MSSSTLRPELVENYGWIGAELLDVPMSTSQPASESHLPVSADEIKALYGEVFEALQVPRRLSGPRRVRRGPFEIASEIFPVGYFSADFVSVFDAGESTFFALGDIAGKGLTAGRWFTHVDPPGAHLFRFSCIARRRACGRQSRSLRPGIRSASHHHGAGAARLAPG